MKKIILILFLLTVACGIAMADYTFNFGLGYNMGRHKSGNEHSGKDTYVLPYGVGLHAGIGWSLKKNSKTFLGIEVAGSFNFNFDDQYHYEDQHNPRIVAEPDEDYSCVGEYEHACSPAQSVRMNTSSTNQLRLLLGFELLRNVMVVPFAGAGLDNVAALTFNSDGSVISYYGTTRHNGVYNPGYTDVMVLGGLRIEFHAFYVEFMASRNVLYNTDLKRFEFGIGLMERSWYR